MNWAAQKHPVEAIVEWTASIALALAVAWACLRLGLSPTEAALLGVVALIFGFATFRFFGRNEDDAPFRFEPATVEPIAPEEPEELLLQPEDELLELEDRLEDVAPDARVVRLFAAPEPTPGELVERIADFLGDGRRPSPVATLAAEAIRPADASAALQAALANIRASLR